MKKRTACPVLGFVRGAVIEVIPTSAGSLLVVLDHSEPVYDASWKPLTGGAAQLALRQSAAKRATMGSDRPDERSEDLRSVGSEREGAKP